MCLKHYNLLAVLNHSTMTVYFDLILLEQALQFNVLGLLISTGKGHSLLFEILSKVQIPPTRQSFVVDVYKYMQLSGWYKSIRGNGKLIQQTGEFFCILLKVICIDLSLC